MTVDQIAAIVAIIIFSAMSIFQLFLVFGAPFGHLVWGGQYRKLPAKLRLATFLYIIINIIAAFALMEKSKLIKVINMDSVVIVLVWIFFLFFSFSTIANIKSKSKLEKAIMTPLAFIIAFSCIIVTLGHK